MYGMNESYVSPKEKAYNKFSAAVAGIVGADVVAAHDGLMDAMFGDKFTVDEAVAEIRAQSANPQTRNRR